MYVYLGYVGYVMRSRRFMPKIGTNWLTHAVTWRTEGGTGRSSVIVRNSQLIWGLSRDMTPPAKGVGSGAGIDMCKGRSGTVAVIWKEGE